MPAQCQRDIVQCPPVVCGSTQFTRVKRMGLIGNFVVECVAGNRVSKPDSDVIIQRNDARVVLIVRGRHALSIS